MPGSRTMHGRLTHTTRRETLAGLTALSLAGCSRADEPAPPPDPKTASLNTLAKSKGRRFGSAIAWNAGTDGGSIQNPSYTGIIKAECGVVVPENELKWQFTRPDAKTFDFAR